MNETGLCVAGQSGNLAPADKKNVCAQGRDCHGGQYSPDCGLHHEQKAGRRKRQHPAGCKDRQRGIYEITGGFHCPCKKDDCHRGARRPPYGGADHQHGPAPGQKIGNALEVQEAVETLRGQGPEDLTQVCLQLAGNMLYLAGRGTLKDCLTMARRSIEDGSALEKLAQMVRAQGETRK